MGTTATMPTETVTTPPGRRRLRTPSQGGNGVLATFTIPSLVWYLIFTFGPLIAMFYIALTNWASIPSKPEFIGLDNFVKMFSDERIAIASINTVIHLVATLPFQVLGAFMLGYFLSLRPPGHRFFRVVLFIPALISIAQLGTLFSVVFGPDGLINSLLVQFGRDDLQRAWLADTQTAMLCVILISIWSGMGFNAVLFSARLASVDEDVYAAAELDGASHWQRMWRIAFPICIGFFGVMTMLQFLWSLFGSAALILVLTQGGPGQATSTLSWLVYKFAFSQAATGQIGYSQAIGVVLFFLGVIGLLIIRRALRQRY